MAPDDRIRKRAKAHIRYKNAAGKVVPGTTTICGELAKPYLVKWANNLGLNGIDSDDYRDIAAEIGTLIHYMVECDLRGIEPDTTDYTKSDIEAAENGLLKWYEWKKGKVINPILIETPLVSESHQYGGTIDLYAEVDGVLNLIDFKSGKAIYPEMLIQLGAYKHLLLEHKYPVTKARILRIGRDESEGFDDKVQTDLTVQWEMFKHLRAIYDLKKKVA
jgi:hypothetical protein